MGSLVLSYFRFESFRYNTWEGTPVRSESVMMGGVTDSRQQVTICGAICSSSLSSTTNGTWSDLAARFLACSPRRSSPGPSLTIPDCGGVPAGSIHAEIFPSLDTVITGIVTVVGMIFWARYFSVTSSQYRPPASRHRGDGERVSACSPSFSEQVRQMTE